MAYCNVVDIKRRLQHVTIDTTSNPTSEEVTEFCERISKEMDARMNAVDIDTPVTNADRLSVLKMIAEDGVIAIVLMSIDVETDRAVLHRDYYDAGMKRIEKSPAIIRTDDVAGGPGGSTAPPRAFTREGKEW